MSRPPPHGEEDRQTVWAQATLPAGRDDAPPLSGPVETSAVALDSGSGGTSVRAALASFEADVRAGLAQTPKTIPSKYFYDAEGSHLFDAITRLDAYYPTRTERAILTAHAAEIAAALGEEAAMIEYGSGSSDKTRILLDTLNGTRYRLAAYVPIDISPTALAEAAEALHARYPGLPVCPVAADYTQTVHLPDLPPHRRRVVFFPGSTVGNFSVREAEAFFEQAARKAGSGGALLIGADQAPGPGKPVHVLLRAYDDEEGVTAAFNKNLLARLNRDLGADADLDAWAHEARWNAAESRVEMHLVSLADETLTVAGEAVSFHAGETIHTENSRKYAPDALAALAARAGWQRTHRWTTAPQTPPDWFAVELYTLP